MKKPPEWTVAELDAEVKLANANFRLERLREPLENWKVTFDAYHEKFEKLFDVYGIVDPSTLSPGRLVEILRDGLGEVLRYIAGPPVSEDDLVVLSDATLVASSPTAPRSRRDQNRPTPPISQASTRSGTRSKRWPAMPRNG